MAVRQRAETALKDSNSELEAFAYSVSHDLRAPLRAMQGFSQALLEDCAEQLTQGGLDHARRIAGAAVRLDRLIQDLLLYSRISQGSLELDTVDLAAALDEAIAQLEVPLRETHAELSGPQRSCSVLAHQPTLIQVLGNLLSNAIKFVAAGVRPGVTFGVEEGAGFGRLWVQDNGIGIAPEFHKRIFRVFERLHGVEVYPGTGVGLAIVRKGVERMNGHVGLDSELHKGSRFWIELPLASESGRQARVSGATCASS
jgi:signal transduction histidine kinase